ncbi:tetrapyrrole biosynthesis, uroporphyrinogen III synthase [Stipitochalara longipes BDJ]|nr:tetrapyrrole biosynthesis, uroporphyrinogen III synthase [Stipitochalara longipes BDJ]
MSSIGSGSEEATPLLLLKTKSTPNDSYEDQFSAKHDGVFFEPTFVPVLEHNFLEEGLDIMRDLLHKKQIGNEDGSTYGGLIFTSQRAVEAFAKLVGEGKGDHQWPFLQNIPIYTVGPATSRALRAIPQNPPLNIYGSNTGNGEALAHYILDHYSESYRNNEIKPPLLFLAGEQRRDVIPKTLMDSALPDNRQIRVDELVVYGTGVMESFEEEFTKLLLETKDKRMRWVVVFSPTGCEAMLRSLDLLDPETGRAKASQYATKMNIYIATIGPTTRDFLRTKFGFEPHVCASKPSPEGVEEGIRQYLKDKC